MNMNKEMKELINIMKWNTFYTGSGAILALVALIIALIALFR